MNIDEVLQPRLAGEQFVDVTDTGNGLGQRANFNQKFRVRLPIHQLNVQVLQMRTPLSLYGCGIRCNDMPGLPTVWRL